MLDARDSAGICVDMDHEMLVWQTMFRDRYDHALPDALVFSRSVATIKFGYDAYLRHSHQHLEELLPHLRDKYLSEVPRYEQVEWPLAEVLIRKTWTRMQAGD